MRIRGLIKNIMFFGCVTAVSMLLPAMIAAQDKLPDSEPKLIGSSKYTLPDSAVEAEIDGPVRVAIHIDKTGQPKKAVMIAGPIWPCGKMPLMAIDDVSRTLADGLMKLKFSPGIKDGKPVSADLVLKIVLINPKLDLQAIEAGKLSDKPKNSSLAAGILNSTAIKLAKPEYPIEAKVIGAGGAVNIQVIVDEHGEVERAGALSGHSTLQYAAREAACASKFAPGKFGDKSVKILGIVVYNFVPSPF